MSRAILFDLDGTLVNSRGDLATSANAALATVGLPQLAPEVVIGFVGGGARRLIERSVGPEHLDLLPKVLEAFFVHYRQHLVDTTRPYPGMEELLGLLPSPLGVLTNKGGELSREICRRLGLSGRFQAIWGPDDTPGLKPDPRGALALCAHLGARPEESVLIGDTRVDAETARAAGMRFIGVRWGFARPGELEAFADAPLAATAADLQRLLLG